MLTSICWLHMGIWTSSFSYTTAENNTQLDQKCCSSFCRMSSLLPSELGQKQPVREDVPCHTHQELRYDKAKFSHLGRNKESYG